MEEMILNFFSTYGWQLTLIALGGIVILGVLKAFKVFDKIPKDYRKYIYAAIATLLSAIGSVVYLVVNKAFGWTSFILLVGVLYALNQTMYAVYETYGVRRLFKWIADTIKKLFTKNKKDNIDDDELIE